MPDFKLVATDMDGTFLRDDRGFDKERLHRLLPKFREQNILFTVASGRAMLALEKVFEGFEKDIAFVAENGSFVQYQDEILFEAQMDKDFYLAIIQLIEKLPDLSGFLLSGRKGAYTSEKAPNRYVTFAKYYYENVQRVSDFSALDDDIFKITVNFTEKTIHEREAWLNETLHGATAMTTGFQSLDIVLSNVDKSTGLRAMCQQLGLQAEQVLAFGDNMNDYQMMAYAGTAIAPANARQEIKAISNTIIGHCNDESVIAYMEGLVK
ncbi:Cof-type HAD-IIB family hydrolase [Streptococcus dentasini]